MSANSSWDTPSLLRFRRTALPNLTRTSSIYVCASCSNLAVYVSTDYKYPSCMRRFTVAAILMVLVFLPTPACAQKAVLKDGHVVACEKYRIKEGKLFCVGTEGAEVSILLKDIDANRTRELNEKESKPPLNLSEQPTPAQTEPELNGQESLGDLARKANHGQKANTSKHVFTDDDVAHGQASGKEVVSVVPADLQGKIASAQAVIDRAKDRTPRELSEGVVGENQFPGRDNWEQRLFRQKEVMLNAARAALDAIKLQLDAATQEQRINAGKAATSLYSDFSTEKYRYDQLVAEGVRKAADWERHR